MRMATALFILLLSATAASAGTEAQLRDIDHFVATVLQTLPEIPSIGLAIVHDGKSYARAYGYADIAHKVRSDANTGYYNGSNTKAYTAVVCTMLEREGKLDLDAPITKYLPELHFKPPIDANQLTLRRFLSHTSGIENGAITFRTAFSGEHTPEGLVKILGLSTPGKGGFHYDNMGYVVASLVIERVTGKKWQDVLDQKLFQPLGMSRTTSYMSRARRYPIASPYDMDGTGAMALVPFGWKRDSMMHAAGGIVTTPADLAKWMEANLNDGRVGDRQILPSAAMAETHRQQTPATRNNFIFAKGSGYGFGWYQSDLHGESLIYHGGGFEGWRSVFSFLPDKKIAIGAMTNAGLSHSPLELVSAYAYDRLMNVPDVEATYAAKLGELRTRWDTLKKNQIAETEKRAQRHSMLAHRLDDYVGRYESPTYGTLTIKKRRGTLIASIGTLSSALEPFTDPETARIELTPGTGEILRFAFTSDAKPDSVKWGDEVMVRR